MRLSESWRTIGDSLVIDGGVQPWSSVDELAPTWAQRARSWRVLFGDSPRSLVVPSQDRHAQRSSVKFFITHPLNRLYARMLLRSNRLLRRLPELTLPPLDGPTLLDELPLPKAAQVAFQIGTPGPYQKVSMLIMADNGKPVTLTKIALKQSADDMVSRESRWLRELGHHERLQHQVPRLLTHGSVRNGRGYLSLSVAQGSATTRVFTRAHATFLSELARVRTVTTRFADSAAQRYLIDTFASLRPLMPAPMAATLADGLAECADRLADWVGPFVLAHGDFAPWNVRLHDDGIFVFDWEYAADGSLALHDFFHFCLAPQALTGRIGLKQLRAVLLQAQELAHRAHPAFDWKQSIVAAQCLGYLLHTVLYYCASCGRAVEDHPIIRAYRRLIEERAQWIG